MNAFRDNPKWELEAWKKKAQQEWHSSLSKSSLQRDKRKALKTMTCDIGEQYNELIDYVETLKQLNSNTIFKFCSEDGEERHSSLPIF